MEVNAFIFSSTYGTAMGDTKLTKTKPFAARRDWPKTTMAQIWGKQRFQGRFWKILKVAFVSLADGLTDRSKEKCLHSPLGQKDSFGIDSARLVSRSTRSQKTIAIQPLPTEP